MKIEYKGPMGHYQIIQHNYSGSRRKNSERERVEKLFE